MSDIAKALERRPDYPTKFFGFELGALTKCETQNDRYIVNGKREAEDLAKVLDTFIEKYVLCSQCRNPETEMHIKSGEILLKCRACGTVAPCDSSHRLSTYIIKNPPSALVAMSNMSKAERREAKRKARAVDTTQEEEEDDDDWAVSTSPDSVSQRRLVLLGGSDRLEGADDVSSGGAGGDGKAKRLSKMIKPGTNPIPTLSKFFESPPSDEEVLSQVRELVESNQWSESQFFKILFGSMFPKPLPKENFITKVHSIRLFVTSQKQQKVILYCIEKLCQMDSSAVPLLPSILNCFWEESVLDEEIIQKWYKHPNKHLPPKLSAKIRQESKVFVEWLDNADEPEEF
eukprot:TRINITY_DN7593_c0_g1_i1.p1 TRINITY_DN7593_c0_g1~~TRINITY_DN7593_c0_g1_i1.p1  ORF type:complete len:389 (+),score=110.12 TRINITY_DN7593_c0_g1_i1:133-1167(+)